MTSTNQSQVQVTFWGTRGSISTPGRLTEKYGGNTPCVSVHYEDTSIIFDAGTGIRNLGLKLIEESRNRGDQPYYNLFLSHTHWDHIQGLPFFEPVYTKDTNLNIYGSPRKRNFLTSVLKGQMDYEYFPVEMSEVAGNIIIHEISEEVINMGSGIIDWREQFYHPGGSVSYRLKINGKKIVYATDVELDHMFNSKSKGQNREAAAKGYEKFIEGADLLIADGQYTEEEYQQKIGWGHTSIPVLLNVAYQSRVKQLAVFHHDPQHSDKLLDELWIKNRGDYCSEDSKMNIFWAREGMTLAI